MDPTETRSSETPPDLTSIVTVSFNSGDHLLRCVRSALHSRAPVEVLVVDNASTDGSLEAMHAGLAGVDPRLTILRNERNVGFARANNQAVRVARGAWVLLVNPDCEVEPDTIERMRTVMEAHPDVGMAGCLVLNPDGTEQAGCRREQPTPGKALVRALGLGRLARRLKMDWAARDFVRRDDPLPDRPVEVDAISGAFMFVRRAALEDVGGLDEGYFLHCEDLDWCERFRQSGWKVLFVPDVTVVHHKGSSSRDRPVRVLWHMHRGMIRYYQKFFRNSYPRPFLWLVFIGVWLRFLALAGVAWARRLVGKRPGAAAEPQAR